MMDAFGVIMPEILPKKLLLPNEEKSEASTSKATLDLAQIEIETIKTAFDIYGTSTECRKIKN